MWRKMIASARLITSRNSEVFKTCSNLLVFLNILFFFSFACPVCPLWAHGKAVAIVHSDRLIGYVSLLQAPKKHPSFLVELFYVGFWVCFQAHCYRLCNMVGTVCTYVHYGLHFVGIPFPWSLTVGLSRHRRKLFYLRASKRGKRCANACLGGKSVVASRKPLRLCCFSCCPGGEDTAALAQASGLHRRTIASSASSRKVYKKSIDVDVISNFFEGSSHALNVPEQL